MFRPSVGRSGRGAAAAVEKSPGLQLLINLQDAKKLPTAPLFPARGSRCSETTCPNLLLNRTRFQPLRIVCGMLFTAAPCTHTLTPARVAASIRERTFCATERNCILYSRLFSFRWLFWLLCGSVIFTGGRCCISNCRSTAFKLFFGSGKKVKVFRRSQHLRECLFKMNVSRKKEKVREIKRKEGIMSNRCSRL